MFMWWKGKLQPGNYDKLISAMDFYPTALDAADISIPKDLSWMAFLAAPVAR